MPYITDYINRYDDFKENESGFKFIPFIRLEERASDIYVVHQRGRVKFDELSYKYYGNPNFGWLILQANSEKSSIEWSVRNESVIRIPFPLQLVIDEYNNKVRAYNNLYGVNG